jgi:hypothetical protein
MTRNRRCNVSFRHQAVRKAIQNTANALQRRASNRMSKGRSNTLNECMYVIVQMSPFARDMHWRIAIQDHEADTISKVCSQNIKRGAG